LVISLKINVRVNRKDNQEKLATFGTQDEDKHYKQKKKKAQQNTCWTLLYANKHK